MQIILYCTIQVNAYRRSRKYAQHAQHILHTNRRTHTTRNCVKSRVSRLLEPISLAFWSARLRDSDKSNDSPQQPQVCLPLRITALTMSTLSSMKHQQVANYRDDNNASPFSLCSFDRPDLPELQFPFRGPDRRRGFASERHGGQYWYPYAWHIYNWLCIPQTGVEM